MLKRSRNSSRPYSKKSVEKWKGEALGIEGAVMILPASPVQNSESRAEPLGPQSKKKI